MRVLFNQKCYFENFHFKLFLIMIVCVKLSTAPSPDNQYQQNDDMDEEELCQVEDPLGTSLSDIHPEVSLSTGSPMCEDIRERQTYNSELPIRNPQKRSRTSTSTYDPYSFSDNEENEVLEDRYDGTLFANMQMTSTPIKPKRPHLQQDIIFHEHDEDETIINNKHVDILGTSLQELQAQDNNQLKKLKESVDIPSAPLTEHQTDYNQQDQQLEGSEDILGSSLAELHSNDNNQSGAMSFSFTIEDILYANKKKEESSSKGKQNERKSLLEKALSTSIECLRNKNMCRKRCLYGLSLEFIREARYRIWTKNYQQRVEWFSDKFIDADFDAEKPLFFANKGKTVCGQCFRSLYKVNKNFYYKWIKKFCNGAISSGYIKGRPVSKAKEDTVLWLQDYAKYRGDFMPDRDITMLPYKTRKIDVYNLYVNEMTEKLTISVSKATFYHMWKNEFRILKIKKTNSFSRCQTCTTLTTRLEKTRDQAEREAIKKSIMVHNSRQMAERAYYRTKRKNAEENKRHYMSIIIDGMDQSKTDLPHFTGRRSKALDVANLLQTHVQGIMNHGLNRFTTYIDINEYSHDSNLIMNTLLKELYESSVLMGSFLPEILYMQADNCFRENRNRFMLAFCELLVRKNIFKEVHLSFLPVGHTHEDIDAAFSKISDKLRKNDAETLTGFMHLLPSCKITGGIYDIRGWLTPHITPLSGQTSPLHFKFSIDEAKKIRSEYKGAHHRPWIPMRKPMLKKMPTGIPKIVSPFFHKINFDALSKNIEKCKYLFSDIVQDTQYRWWKRYVSHLQETSSSKEKTLFYSKRNARWLLPLLPRRTNNPQPHVVNLPQQIQEMIDKEIDDPVILMPSPKKKNKGKTQKKTTKKQIKGKKTKRHHRTVFHTYVYGFIHIKKQKYFFLLAELIEILWFLSYFHMCIITTCNIIALSALFHLFLKEHIFVRVQVKYIEDLNLEIQC